jgi:hypothetical protein
LDYGGSQVRIGGSTSNSIGGEKSVRLSIVVRQNQRLDYVTELRTDSPRSRIVSANNSPDPLSIQNFTANDTNGNPGKITSSVPQSKTPAGTASRKLESV